MRSDSPQENQQPVSSTTWHLCWQAAIGRDFFTHPSMCERIRGRLIDAHLRPGRVLLYFQVLSAEIHVVSEVPPGDSAGAIARAVGNVVARWVRESQPVRSPVLAGPYRAHRIRSTAELRNEARMLAWRPVYLGLCATPTHYAHGALRIALGMTTAQGFDTLALLQAFGLPVHQARAALRACLARRPSEREWREWELMHGLALAIGSVGTQAVTAVEVRGAAAALVAAGGTDGIDGALRLLEFWVCAKLRGPPMSGLQATSSASAVRGRALVACLAVEHGLCSAASVARYFGRAKATLCEQMAACRSRASDCQIVATPLERILEESLALGSVKRAPFIG